MDLKLDLKSDLKFFRVRIKGNNSGSGFQVRIQGKDCGSELRVRIQDLGLWSKSGSVFRVYLRVWFKIRDPGSGFMVKFSVCI